MTPGLPRRKPWPRVSRAQAVRARARAQTGEGAFQADAAFSWEAACSVLHNRPSAFRSRPTAWRKLVTSLMSAPGSSGRLASPPRRAAQAARATGRGAQSGGSSARSSAGRSARQARFSVASALARTALSDLFSSGWPGRESRRRSRPSARRSSQAACAPGHCGQSPSRRVSPESTRGRPSRKAASSGSSGNRGRAGRRSGPGATRTRLSVRLKSAPAARKMGSTRARISFRCGWAARSRVRARS